MLRTPRIVAYVPARGGSKRIPNKNVRPLAGHPLIGYTISAARESGAFDRVIVSTDSPEIATVAQRYGAEVPFLRPAEYAGDLSPDIEWVRHALTEFPGPRPEAFAILRPTSPFRQAATIRRARRQLLEAVAADSLRAVQRCSEHPGKMWVARGPFITPLLPFSTGSQRWQSTPYQTLPEIFVQNASLEIAWTRVVEETGTIEGHQVVPFFTEGFEGFDLNDALDWDQAELLISRGEAALPDVAVPCDGESGTHG